MEIIYRTIDGKEFADEQEAVAHEVSLSVHMWDSLGRPVDKTCMAYIVYVDSEEGFANFLHLAKLQGDEDISFSEVFGGKGIYIWDEIELSYYRILVSDAKTIATVVGNLIEEGVLS